MSTHKTHYLGMPQAELTNTDGHFKQQRTAVKMSQVQQEQRMEL
jgi:hypothetical protein